MSPGKSVYKGCQAHPTITITTQIIDNDKIDIHIADNAMGMASEVQQR
ncbi:hypothetical protein RintRC_7666 [Richelia intracellularis]|nr:hypothetical protein RintRC_7666 [Richelia intracellularis]